MDKARRHELKMLKYKKRLDNYQLKGDKHHSLRTTGKPCSCAMCSPIGVKPKHKHTFRVLSTEEVMANRSSKYEFIDFDNLTEVNQ